MKSPAHLNLILAWIGILLGFGSGFFMGLNFQKEKWLGGYASWKRRLYRLGHISFFGLAVMNLAFYFTVKNFSFSRGVEIASIGFALGAISMPICCAIMAHQPKWRAVFLVPSFWCPNSPTGQHLPRVELENCCKSPRNNARLD